jgi:signal transduction histidine kinase
VKIVVEIVPKDENTYLEIQVIDTGIGIKEEDQDKLFKLFGFVQDTKNLNKNGIGLGLAISDEIV